MLERLKSAVSILFINTTERLAGKNLGKIPGVLPLYHALFRKLWANRRIIEVAGSKMYVDFGHELPLRKTFEAYITAPNWDEATTDAFIATLKNGSVVLDLGANIGYYSLLAARLVGSQGKVYSFEPEPNNYALLANNVALNDYQNVITVPKAVSDTSGSVTLKLSNQDSGAHTIRDQFNLSEFTATVNVETVCLDEYFEGCSHPIDVVKMDIEGLEPRAFRGMSRILKDNPQITMFVEFFPELIAQAGYQPAEFARSLMEEHGIKYTHA
jgi:FkbM family methyltransferase